MPTTTPDTPARQRPVSTRDRPPEAAEAAVKAARAAPRSVGPMRVSVAK